MDSLALAANRTWFNFSVNSQRMLKETLRVYSFTGTETANEPYAFAIELVTKNKSLSFDDYIGSEAVLSVGDRSRGTRFIHGVIRQMDYLRTGNAFSHYRCLLVPRLWFLSQVTDNKIFQDMTVCEIIEDVLKKNGFVSESYSFRLLQKDRYPKREYCVQYMETDLHFIDRLCEEEGLSYSSEHEESRHRLCFYDVVGGPRIPGQSAILYHEGASLVSDTAVISDLRMHKRINSDAYTVKEWNFTKPALDLLSKEREGKWENAPVPRSMHLEQYDYPHLYDSQREGKRYADIQLQRQLTFRDWIDGVSDVARFMPGHVFTVQGHTRNDVNRGWWVVSVTHRGEQPGVLEHEAPDDRGFEYRSEFTAIPDSTRFVPERRHRKSRIEGVQSAIVTGPAGEEVYTDEFGRVKVQFHWDRWGQRDTNTTCWVRVAVAHAGNHFGSMTLPRIGQEVLVEFMEGDPDRPLITGRGYNRHTMPPWELPGQKTLTGFQTREFKGPQRNQLIFDDTSGQVQTTLSSDHDKSEVNFGYITRIDHVRGRRDFRGEGFELRTNSWGSARAGKGMYITTFPRGVESHQKDMAESIRNLTAASSQHQKHLGLAVKHGVQNFREHEKPLTAAMDRQNREIRGNGQPHGELTSPHLIVGSSAGVGITAEESIHVHSVDNTILTAQQHISMASDKSILGTAIDRVMLFARRLGMRLVAGSGKVEIWAQTDAMDVIADKVLQIISTRDKVHISSPKEILLTAGGSYIAVNSGGVHMGTKGKFEVKASDHSMKGPASMPYCMPEMREAEPELLDNLRLTDELGRPLDPDKYVVGGSASVVSGAIIQLFTQDASVIKEERQVTDGGGKVNVITGNAIELTPEKEDS